MSKQKSALWPGNPYPLGATWDGHGVNFALFSELAERVELCLFDDAGAETRVELAEVDGFIWHAFLPSVGPGQRYGYRVHGPYDPARGQRSNSAKLLLDPYAKAVEGPVDWDESLFGYRFGRPWERSDADSAAHQTRCVVVNPYFDWRGDRPLRIPYHESVVYETHVRGLTIGHPELPPELRGTYAGLAHPAVVEHLQRLGVTAVELMPVHEFVNDHHLVQRGLSNYWGYNTIGFFAPHHRYAAQGTRGQQVAEFKAMVRRGEFLEHAQVFDNCYGTARGQVETSLAAGQDLILEIDWQGARQVRERIRAAQSIYILPPSRDTLESRLQGRKQDGAEVIGERMRQAVSEMSHWDESDYVVVNDRFEVALADLQAILRANRLRRPAQGMRLSGLIRELLSAT